MITRKRTRSSAIKSLSKFDLGWLVGILDGEGCFSAVKAKKTGYLCTSILVSSTDKDVIARLNSLVPAKTNYIRFYKKNYKTAYTWYVTKRAEVRSICELVFPHMCKRRQNRIKQILTDIERYETK